MTNHIVTIAEKSLWWNDPQFARVRIEEDRTDAHRTYQRHIWIRSDGTESAEKWIRTAR
jgi:hypothetical protein